MQHNEPNKEHPHQLVINVRAEVNQLDNTGRMIRTNGSDSKLFTFLCKNHAEGMKKLEEFFERLSKCNKKQQESDQKT